jgi:hypothetical protein
MSVMTQMSQVESQQQGCLGQGGSWRGNDAGSAKQHCTWWHICGFPSKNAGVKQAGFCIWLKFNHEDSSTGTIQSCALYS